MPAANLVVYRGYVRLTFPVSLGKTTIIQLLFCLIGPTLRPIVIVARATYRTADSCVLLWEGAWIWRPVDEVQRQPSLSLYPLLRLSFKSICIISKSEVEYSVYCIFYAWEQAAKRVLKTREMLPASFNFQFIAKIHHKTLRWPLRDVEKSAVILFQFGRYVMYGNTNCTA